MFSLLLVWNRLVERKTHDDHNNKILTAVSTGGQIVCIETYATVDHYTETSTTRRYWLLAKKLLFANPVSSSKYRSNFPCHLLNKWLNLFHWCHTSSCRSYIYNFTEPPNQTKSTFYFFVVSDRNFADAKCQMSTL